MILDGKTVCLILHPRDELKRFAVSVYRQLLIMKIQSSRPVIIILDHTADRDIQMKLLQHLLRDIDPVSYTHLDVYKRQPREIAFLIMSAGMPVPP